MAYKYHYLPYTDGIIDDDITFKKAIDFLDEHFPHLIKKTLIISPTCEKIQPYTDANGNFVISVCIDYIEQMVEVSSQVEIENPAWTRMGKI